MTLEEDDNIAVGPQHANQNWESATCELSIWSLSNYCSSQPLRMAKETVCHPHLLQTFPMSASYISRNDHAMFKFHSGSNGLNSVVSLNDTQLELRPQSVRLPIRPAILRSTKEVRFGAQVSDDDTMDQLIHILKCLRNWQPELKIPLPSLRLIFSLLLFS